MDWCAAWTKERKDAELRVYRASCRLRCLEANLDRIEPDKFDQLMAQIEVAQSELHAAFYAKLSVISPDNT